MGWPSSGALVTKDQQQAGSGAEPPLDEALVAATLAGDEEAFAQLVRRYLRKAMAVAVEYTRTREDAEDAVQETFRRVLENLDRFRLDRRFAPWFFTILRNCARNVAKTGRARAHEALTNDLASGIPGPYEETSRIELRRGIDQALERLPAMQRICFQLCLVEGFSSAEAADAMGLAESTVRVHVFKARRTLQELLQIWRDGMEA